MTYEQARAEATRLANLFQRPVELKKLWPYDKGDYGVEVFLESERWAVKGELVHPQKPPEDYQDTWSTAPVNGESARHPIGTFPLNDAKRDRDIMDRIRAR